MAALEVDGEEDPGVEVDEEEADPEAVESEGDDELGSELRQSKPADDMPIFFGNGGVVGD